MPSRHAAWLVLIASDMVVEILGTVRMNFLNKERASLDGRYFSDVIHKTNINCIVLNLFLCNYILFNLKIYWVIVIWKTCVSSAAPCMYSARWGGFSVYATLLSKVLTIYLTATCFDLTTLFKKELYLLEITLLTTDPLFFRTLRRRNNKPPSPGSHTRNRMQTPKIKIYSAKL
jgi:hypothetical protein